MTQPPNPGPYQPQPQYAPPPPPVKKKRKALRIVLLVLGIPVALFILIGIIAVATSGGRQSFKDGVQAGAGSSVTSVPSAPSAASAAPDRAGAAAILKANADHYRQVFHQGQTIVGRTQYPDGMTGLQAMSDPSSPAARFRDYRKNPDPERDLTYMKAFKDADSKFTADNEPTALISKWQDDAAAAQVAISNWVQVATSYQIRAKSQADLDTAAATVERALVAADGDADAIGKG